MESEVAGMDEATDSDLEVASDHREHSVDVDTTPPEVALEQNWKRYRLRARQKQVEAVRTCCLMWNAGHTFVTKVLGTLLR